MSTVYELEVIPKGYYWYNGMLRPKVITTRSKKEKVKYKKWFKSLDKKQRAIVKGLCNDS